MVLSSRRRCCGWRKSNAKRRSTGTIWKDGTHDGRMSQSGGRERGGASADTASENKNITHKNKKTKKQENKKTKKQEHKVLVFLFSL